MGHKFTLIECTSKIRVIEAVGHFLSKGNLFLILFFGTVLVISSFMNNNFSTFHDNFMSDACDTRHIEQFTDVRPTVFNLSCC